MLKDGSQRKFCCHTVPGFSISTLLAFDQIDGSIISTNTSCDLSCTKSPFSFTLKIVTQKYFDDFFLAIYRYLAQESGMKLFW